MKLKKCARFLRTIFGWVLIVQGGLWGVSVGICTFLTLFGVLETGSFGEWLLLFVTGLVAAIGFFVILRLGIRLKNSARRNAAAAPVVNPSLPEKKKMPQPVNVKALGKCEKCGVPLRAFHYYRDNHCETYCEKCGEFYQAAHAAPYRTIELGFGGHQREGFALTVEVGKWPSLERCYLQWDEWNETGGNRVKVDLPANYMTEHTVEEFLAEYILKENDVTKHIQCPVNLLRQIRDRLTESGVLQEKRTTYAGEITLQGAPNTFSLEEQQRFENRRYQYSQDTGRDGLSPEIAANNRGMVFADGRPAAKEVAARLEEMRNAGSLDNAADIGPTGQSQEESVFVIYEGHWAGKAENGEDKIFLKVFENECVITYEYLTRNCYATPPMEDIRRKVRHRSLPWVSTWSLEDLLLFINQAFHLSINICDCCSEEQYRAWIEQQNTEFYSMEIMVDGTRQECMVRRVNEKSCEEVRFQGRTYFWKESEVIRGLRNYDYAVEGHLNEKVYYLYHAETPNKNLTLYWTVSQITESTFEMLKHPPCNHENIVFGREIGQIGGDEPERRGVIYKILALATGRTISYYLAGDGARNIYLETRRKNMSTEEKFAPVFLPCLAEYQMKMHTDSGEAYCFTLTGLKAYYPNMADRCGPGTDEWCFHCKYNDENYILRFSDNSGYGTSWDCALIHKENAEQLEKLSVGEWLKLMLKSETKIFYLHPDTIDAAKNIVQDTSSRCGPISDDGFYGR